MHKRFLKAHLLCLALYCTGCTATTWSFKSLTALQEAEELIRKDEFDGAIAVYEKHIQNRLAVENRPKWENPYFYKLIIGDLELRKEKPDAAAAAYEQAEKNGIDPLLVADRYRSLASWFEGRGELDKALQVLTQHRDLDTLLFDSAMDRINREIVAKEDAARESTKR